MSVSRFTNGSKKKGRHVKVASLSAGWMDADTMGAACESLSEIDVPISVSTVNGEMLEEDERSFMEFVSDCRHADIVFLRIHGDPSALGKFDRLKEVIVKNDINAFLHCGNKEIMLDHRDLFKFSDEDYDLVSRFAELGGLDNSVGLLKWVCSRVCGLDVEVPEPFVQRAQGLYLPGIYDGIDEDAYLGSLDPDKPTVGIMYHQRGWVERKMAHIDALTECLRENGANVIPVFFISTPSEVSGSIGVAKVIEKYFTKDGKPIVGSVVIATGFSQLSMSNPGEGEVDREIHNFFEDLNVPILHAELILKSRKDWMEDTVGMGPAEITASVIWPEFDGQILTVPLEFRERDEKGNYHTVFVPDRVQRIAELAIKWAVLRSKPVSEIKAVVMLNMYPPTNDRVGGAGGLDTFESIRRMMQKMAEEGYTIDHVPETSAELLDEVMAGLTNDLEWVPEEEIPARAADMVGLERYMEWFNNISAKPREAMCRNWGDPPGEITTHSGKFIIPGVRNGNLFIGIQPNRGHHANAEQFYHSTEVVMPHQYFAYYRWIRDVFSADVLIHMGTHGTLEWLPGKGNGLSQDCYPDVVLDTMPNVYPYIINDPGEGMEAKRRTNSVLIGYMVAAMTRADGYEDMAALDSALQNYLDTSSRRQDEKSDINAQTIHELVSKLDMFKELGLSKDATVEEVIEKSETIYDYISDLKDAIIKDGLHILGHPPEGLRMKEMVYCMTRLRNGRTPSLRASVAAAYGHDIYALLEDPSGKTSDGRLNGAVLDEIDRITNEVIDAVYEKQFRKTECLEAADAIIRKEDSDVRTVIEFICDRLYPDLLGIADEMFYTISGSHARYVPPGPSGSPTRGNAHLLPTGRNYYSIDPNTIPDDASWRIGVKMADDMIERHVEEKGCYPENVGIIVWATDTMKTGGDDIAYILYLMGLRPKWGSYGGRVVGLEVIPLSELGRPRIDVTLRISGMFRDSFPNLVQLIDYGVELVSELDEDDDSNYLRKHLRKDIVKYIKEGLSEEDARSRSLIRIFGDPPGQHGCGTGVLIESSKWDTIEDLAQVYTTWGSYAYGRKWKGEKTEDAFINRMSVLDVTVKNHNDREFDLLDIDDDYEVLGGLNAVVRAYGGYKPMCFMGDSSDTERLRLRTLEEETAYVMRSRVLNPKWLEGLKPHGFRGAMELSKLTQYMLGWDATSDSIEDWMYQAVTERFVLDEDTREWIRENNPYALKEMIEDLLEIIDRDLWDAPEDIRNQLRDLFIQSEGDMEELGSRGAGKNTM